MTLAEADPSAREPDVPGGDARPRAPARQDDAKPAAQGQQKRRKTHRKGGARAEAAAGAAGIAAADTDTAETEAEEQGPTRTCLLTRARGPKERMIRFVAGPDGAVHPDLAARLPGRGMWLSARADVLDKAAARRVFSRAARAELAVPADLSRRVAEGLVRRLIDLIALARRAGQAVFGFEAVREWIAAGRAGLLVEAADGAAEGRAKLLAAAHAVSGAGVPVVAPLPAALLGRPFGREHVVHVALAPGRLAGQIAAEAARLEGFAPGGGIVASADGTE
ncbi:MAG: RNA-binding protein [Alphaproteobacteria bacterium]|nr:RNA-binding protein [Alphaproteobacteria bacterium]